MADIANARKTVALEIYNNWSQGPSLMSVFADGDMTESPSKDIPYVGAITVAQSDTQTAQTSTFSRHELQNNLQALSSQKLTQTQINQLFAGNGAAIVQMLRAQLGAVRSDWDTRLITTMLSNADNAVANHSNLAGATLTAAMVYAFVGKASEISGLTPGSPKVMLVNPQMSAAIRTAFNNGFDNQRPAGFADVGLPFLGVVAGIPAFEHASVPGGVGAYAESGTIASATAASGVVTINFDSAHPFVAGQQVYTSGLEAANDVPSSSPCTVTVVDADTITIDFADSSASPPSDGAVTLGTSPTVYSATAMAIMAPTERVWWSADSVAPQVKLVDTESGNGVGVEQQVFHQHGHVIAADACKVLHAPLLS